MKKILLFVLLTFNLNATQTTYAILKHTVAANTAGGTCTNGSFATRTINEVTTPQGWVSLSTNQFTLDAGTYRISAIANGYRPNAMRMQLYNETDTTIVSHGTSGFNNSGQSFVTRSVISTQFAIASEKTFTIKWRCGATGTTTGWGLATNLDSAPETYLIIEIEKIL